MAASYRLVLRKNLKKGAPEGSQLYYAQARSTGTSEMDRLCSLISERSTVSSADVKGVLDSLIYVIKLELSDGKIVRLADLGNFRLTFGSEGTETEKEFTSACIRRPKYTFVPGKALRDQAQIIKYEKYSPEIKTVIDDEPCPYPHE